MINHKAKICGYENLNFIKLLNFIAFKFKIYDKINLVFH